MDAHWVMLGKRKVKWFPYLDDAEAVRDELNAAFLSGLSSPAVPSKDYEDLYQWVLDGGKALGWVSNLSFQLATEPEVRAVSILPRMSFREIGRTAFGAISFKTGGNERKAFIEECERLDLHYIKTKAQEP